MVTKSGSKKRANEDTNKAQLIRDAFKKHGLEASAKEVQDFTEKKGVSVASAQISNIRTKLKGGVKVKKDQTSKGIIPPGMISAAQLIRACGNDRGEAIRAIDSVLELVDVMK